MKKLYLLDDAIISPLGFSTEENIKAIREGRSGLKRQQKPEITENSFYAGIIDESPLNDDFKAIGNPKKYTKLEKMMLLAVQQVLNKNPNLNLAETALVVTTTKGNINLLKDPGNFPEIRIKLSELGKVIADFFGFAQTPIIVSNACISGGLGLAVARRLGSIGKIKNAFVVGGDLVSDFVVSGFNSFQALSQEACKPFSNDRNGISLGEAAAAMLVSIDKPESSGNIALIGDATVNDANHISGPSRTGEGLYQSIQKALKETSISAAEIDFLSAHGTATIYNDEMESIAFHRSALQDTPLHSLKGYYGHTLGASALIESIITKHSMLKNYLYSSKNFGELGVSKSLNIIQQNEEKEINYGLKTASGFGGCNLALVLKKE
ncbi:beta-ketoacyl synthase N-terminal-like domain-containing protein [Salegentibacter salarius]|uniref:Nodulation protein E n=1 Tax=Salegentibacter salarius TaxID=435906 RepID=A0A2N0TU05_9FLAO|nr:beta-ketoacyl synthase N-terminal-like domain-containing protein [Salegentibacter salarius]OEY72462.1 beta-ketoacyl synthase [Salegentibacter salarius]PKD18168.1 beta-ketoacyl synthase [Salegentibacter salarius]SLK03340.1 3-oxoacyl-[acyl-carrier-protein] synthase-1 [Salegentibacter salarius]